MSHLVDKPCQTGRRTFLRDGSLVLFAAGVDLASAARLFAAEDDKKRHVRIGLVTDLHYADKQPAGSRHYRETPDKLVEAAKSFEKEKPDFVVCVGDTIDSAKDVDTEKKWLAKIQAEFAKLPGEKHYVLGNHCVATLTKAEFLKGVKQKESYYSFDAGGYHFVVLDACFRKDGVEYSRNNFDWTDPNIPPAQIAWLKEDLTETKNKSIVFVHQRLDMAGHYGVKNAPDVRKVLQESKKVLAVVQGHNHVNDHQLIGSIHYCTLMAMIEGSGEENNAYATMEVLAGDAIRIRGFRKQENYSWG